MRLNVPIALAVLLAAGAAMSAAPVNPPREAPPAGEAVATDVGGAFTVGGIDVDYSGKTADAARFAAWRAAQRKAWPQLWARLSAKPAAEAPKLADPALDAMVAGIEVESERLSATRYIARLGVVFDRARAAKYLGGGARVVTSHPMLLMPVLNDGGVRVVYEAKSPWLRAWTRLQAESSPIQYVRASQVGGDPILLSAWQAERSDRTGWTMLMNRFGTADVLMAEARLDRAWPGGPVTGTFAAYHGPGRALLGRFRLRATSGAGLEAMLDAAVKRTDQLYAEALRAGKLRGDTVLAQDFAGDAGEDGAVPTAPLLGAPASAPAPAPAKAASAPKNLLPPGVTP